MSIEILMAQSQEGQLSDEQLLKLLDQIEKHLHDDSSSISELVLVELSKNLKSVLSSPALEKELEKISA